MVRRKSLSKVLEKEMETARVARKAVIKAVREMAVMEREISATRRMVAATRTKRAVVALAETRKVANQRSRTHRQKWML